MRSFFIFFLIGLMLLGCTGQGSKKQDSATQKVTEIAPENLKEIEISVYGMSCEGCERTIQTAVSKLPGIQEVKASHLDSVVVVKFDKNLSGFEEMKAAITDKGYTVNDYKEIVKQ